LEKLPFLVVLVRGDEGDADAADTLPLEEIPRFNIRGLSFTSSFPATAGIVLDGADVLGDVVKASGFGTKSAIEGVASMVVAKSFGVFPGFDDGAEFRGDLALGTLGFVLVVVVRRAAILGQRNGKLTVTFVPNKPSEALIRKPSSFQDSRSGYWAPNAKQVAHMQRGPSRQQIKTTPRLACVF
jgi:hypothetical protein